MKVLKQNIRDCFRKKGLAKNHANYKKNHNSNPAQGIEPL